MRRAGSTAIPLLCAVVLAACGGSSTPTAPNPPGNAYQIVIGATGVVSPTELVVPLGTRVLFTNSHNVSHEMTSDPHPEHNMCPELNQVGLLQPGRSRETGNLITPRTCSFHDHNDANNRSLQGRIVIR